MIALLGTGFGCATVLLAAVALVAYVVYKNITRPRN